MDAHAAAEQAAFACLCGVVDWVFDDIRGLRFWLRVVPGVHLLVDRRQGLVFVDELSCLGVTRSGGEQCDHCGAGSGDVRLQRFPGFREYRALIASWMMLLLLSGESAISSLAAARMIQKAGCERKSTINVLGSLPA